MMQVSVDISLYPLQESYLEPIVAFIEAVENVEGVDVVRNELSTQLHGEYETIMSLLTKEVYATFEANPHAVFTIKIVGNNRKGIF
jgi:uncharacterized protein YqgV (UPF0045/DUF77 family)